MTLVPHVPEDEPARDLPDFDELVERIVHGDASSARAGRDEAPARL